MMLNAILFQSSSGRTRPLPRKASEELQEASGRKAKDEKIARGHDEFGGSGRGFGFQSVRRSSVSWACLTVFLLFQKADSFWING